MCPLGAPDIEMGADVPVQGEEVGDRVERGGAEGDGREEAAEREQGAEGGRDVDGGDLAHQAEERPVLVSRRRRPIAPTAAEIAEHELTHEPYRSWCRACVAGRGRADAHILRDEGEKGLPIVGVDYGYLWAKNFEDPVDEEGAPPDGVRTSSPILCGRCSRDRWIFGHLCEQKGNTERNRGVLAKELCLGGYPRIIVRSDGEAPMVAHVRAAVAVAQIGDIPVEALVETTSRGQSAANGLAEGAVKEVKAKVRTMRHFVEEGLRGSVPDTHDVLAWLVTHATMTINWYRPGVDGKTPYEKRFGKKFRRPMAVWGQKVLWMAPGKQESRIGADSRWKEGIFLGILGAGGGSQDYAIGTHDGVVPARAFKPVLGGDAWDRELLLAVKGLPWDRRRQNVAVRIEIPASVPLPDGFLPPPLATEGTPVPRRVYIRKDIEIHKYGLTPGCPGCTAILAELRHQPHSEECRKRIEEAMRKDLGDGGDRLAAAEDRRAAAAAQPVPMQEGGSSGSGLRRPRPDDEERPAVRARVASPRGGVRDREEGPGEAAAVGTAREHRGPGPRRIRSAEDAGLGDRVDLEQEVGSITSSAVRLGHLHALDVDIAELFCPGRFVEKASLFNLLPGTAFDIRQGWDLTTSVGRQSCWEALASERPELVIGSPPCAQFSVLQALNNKDPQVRQQALAEGIRFLTFCCAVYRWQVERGAHFLHEHPWGASSWKLACVQSVSALPGVTVVCGDQCQFGQKAWHQGTHGWERRHARKRTGWMTSLRPLAEALSCRCSGEHLHATLIGGTAKETERYPPRLVATILKVLVSHLRSKHGVEVNAMEVGVGPHVDEEGVVPSFDNNNNNNNNNDPNNNNTNNNINNNNRKTNNPDCPDNYLREDGRNQRI